MASTMLLLDFDGVMLKNRHAEQYQLRRSAKFVQRVTHMNINVCEKVNKKYYPVHGHTVLMVNNLFDKSVTLEDYNEFVFDKKQMSRLDNVLDADTFAHMSDFNKVIEYCELNNIQWKVFTNAHSSWVTHFTERLGVEGVSNDKIIFPSDLESLKPNALAYDKVENAHADVDQFIFVDDSKTNLVIPDERRQWIPITFHRHNDNADSVMSVLRASKFGADGMAANA